jgi:hypothetical protein
MTLINGFLFDSACENEEEAKIIVGNVLKTIFNRKIKVIKVTSQKVLQGVDTKYHGIRMDAHIIESAEDDDEATVYDLEMEDRPADRKYLPKRIRYYGALHDAKLIEASEDYDKLPDFVSIVILSYDPFGAGDMLYQANTVLTSHPSIPYEDGVYHLYLYCKGRPNFDDENSPVKLPSEHGRKIKEMLEYILTGKKPKTPNSDINEIDDIITKVKGRKEVTATYMRQYDRELSIRREVREETWEEDALKTIRFARKNKISDEITRENLAEEYNYTPEIIDDLFARADAEEKELVT